MTDRKHWAAVVLLILWTTRPAEAYIEARMPLAEILSESNYILQGRIERVDGDDRTMVATIERSLKGDQDYDRIQMNLNVGIRRQSEFLLELLERDDPFLLYYQRRGSQIKSLAHSGDTWFQLFARHAEDDDDVWWDFTHVEIYLPRTYDGSTPDLIKLTDDVLAKRRKAPEPDDSVPHIDARRLNARKARERKRRNAGKSGGDAQLSDQTRWIDLVDRGARWRYRKGRNEASPDAPEHSAWRQTEFDDNTWERGAAPFGYGDGPFGTALRDMRKTGGRPGYTTLFLRRRFELPEGAKVTRLELDVDYDDGCSLWLNGHAAWSLNAPAKPRHNSLAKSDHESGRFEKRHREDFGSKLHPGVNVVAVQVFNRRPDSSDLKLELELRAEIELPPPDAQSVAQASGKFRRLAEFGASSGEARGISWVDLNGDEQLDLCVARSRRSLLLLDEGDGWTEETRRFGLEGGFRAGAWADFDGDDHLDLLTNDFRLFSLTGGRLRPATRKLSVPKNHNTEGAGWIDYDGDGRPDPLITCGEFGIRLWRNEEGGFRDVSRAAGLGVTGFGKGNGDFIAFADYDGDGYTDFLYNLDGGILAHNEGDGTFTRDRQSGIELPGGRNEKRGVSFADFDNDGDLDLFVPATGKARLYRNENDGTFVDVIDGAPDLAANTASFSAAWGDVDHDGSLDLFVAHSQGESYLYLGDGKGGFRDSTEEFGLAGLRQAWDAAFADIDDDGDLDLAVHLERDVVLLRNELEKTPGFTALRVRLHTRRGAVGATVRALDPSGRLLALRELTGGERCGGQASPIAHFALPAGRCRISAILSDGRVAQKDVEVGAESLSLTLHEEDFGE